MKRLIKFRGWNTRDEKMIIPDNIRNNIFTNVDDDCGLHCIILMQFTGLHDKNGKEVYEGDIVKFLLPVQELDYCSSSDIWGTEPQNSFQVCTHATYPIKGIAEIFISTSPILTSIKNIKPKILDMEKIENENDYNDYMLADPDFNAGGADGTVLNINNFYENVDDFLVDAMYYSMCNDNYNLFDNMINIEIIGNIYQNPELFEVQP